MAVLKGSGIHMDFTNVKPQFEDEFNAWCNTEYLKSIKEVPGVLSVARYVARKGAPKYLTVSELENTGIAATPAFRKIKTGATPLGQRMLSSDVSGADATQVLGEQFYPAKPESMDRPFPPYFQIGRHLVPVEIEEAWNEWYNNDYIPCYSKVPGVLYARRYRAIEGACKFMTLYEFAAEDVSESEAWANQRRTSSPQTESMRKVMKHAPGSAGIYQLIKAL